VWGVRCGVWGVRHSLLVLTHLLYNSTRPTPTARTYRTLSDELSAAKAHDVMALKCRWVDG